MTPRQRWPSSKVSATTWPQAGWWCALFSACFLFLFISPLGSHHPFASTLPLFVVAHLFVPLLIWPWTAKHPWWGFAAGALASACVILAAASSRTPALLFLILEFAAVCFLSVRAVRQWEGALASRRVHADHLEEEIHAMEGELILLEENQSALSERLSRYGQLQNLVARLSSILSLEGIIQEIVEQTSRLIVKADLVLLYLVTPEALTLELKAVFRRSGSVSVKAKTGDPFDLWVMRQHQPLMIPEMAKEFRFQRPTRQELGRDCETLMAVPLSNDQRTLGVLRVESGRPYVFLDQDLRLAGIVADLAFLAVENSRLYSRIYKLAITDDLTGLSLRSYFESRFSEEVERSRAQGGVLSLLLIDIDRFKDYNDTFGHSAGDKLLKWLAQVLRQDKQPGDVIGRFGGEEFTYVAVGLGREEAVARAEAIRRRIEENPVELRRLVTQVTVSIGVASFPEDGRSAQGLLQVADQRLYQAKSRGRNQVCSLS